MAKLTGQLCFGPPSLFSPWSVKMSQFCCRNMNVLNRVELCGNVQWRHALPDPPTTHTGMSQVTLYL